MTLLAITRYIPSAEELEAEAQVFKHEGAECGPLHALLVERIRLKMLARAYEQKSGPVS